MLTIEELAAWLGRNAHALRQRVHDGELPARKVGRGWRFSREAIAELLEAPPGAPARRTRSGPPAPSQPLGTPEAAVFLRVPVQTLHMQARRGRVPGWQERGRWRFSRRQLLDWLRGDQMPQGPPVG